MKKPNKKRCTWHLKHDWKNFLNEKTKKKRALLKKENQLNDFELKMREALKKKEMEAKEDKKEE
jgi:hypothetical protein